MGAVLFVSERAGAVDLSMARGNPRILYAHAGRRSARRGASPAAARAAGLWRSMDGGDTWQDLSAAPDAGGAQGEDRRGRLAGMTERVWGIVEAGTADSSGPTTTATPAADQRGPEPAVAPWYYL